MSIIVFNPALDAKVVARKVEILELNGKYYIELQQFENTSDIVALSISLSTEVESLKEKVRVLEEKLMMERSRNKF